MNMVQCIKGCNHRLLLLMTLASAVAMRPMGPQPMMSAAWPQTSNCSMALWATPSGSSKTASSGAVNERG